MAPTSTSSRTFSSVPGSLTKLLDSVEKQEAKEQWKSLREDTINLKGCLKGKRHLRYKVGVALNSKTYPKVSIKIQGSHIFENK